MYVGEDGRSWRLMCWFFQDAGSSAGPLRASTPRRRDPARPVLTAEEVMAALESISDESDSEEEIEDMGIKE